MKRLGLLAVIASLGVPLQPRRSDDERLSPHPVPEPDPVHDFPMVVAKPRQEVRVAPVAAPIVETRQMRRARERQWTKARRR